MYLVCYMCVSGPERFRCDRARSRDSELRMRVSVRFRLRFQRSRNRYVTANMAVRGPAICHERRLMSTLTEFSFILSLLLYTAGREARGVGSAGCMTEPVEGRGR